MSSDAHDANVAELGLGLAALGRPGYVNLDHGVDIADASREAMDRTAPPVLDAAYQAGVGVRRGAFLRGRRGVSRLVA
jgi:hypothetical protein